MSGVDLSLARDVRSAMFAVKPSGMFGFDFRLIAANTASCKIIIINMSVQLCVYI